MFRSQPILVVEDDPVIAAYIAMAIEDAAGSVIGPVASVAEALALAKGQKIAGAVLDGNLADGEVTPLAVDIAANDVPFVVYTGTSLPTKLAEILPNLTVVFKPTSPTKVVATLASKMDL